MKDEYKKIFWRTGLEITPDTFSQADNYFCAQQNLIRKLLNLQYYGLLPVNDMAATTMPASAPLGYDTSASHVNYWATPSLTVSASLNGPVISIEQLSCNGVTKEGHLIQFNNDQLTPLRNQRLMITGSMSGCCYVVIRINSFEHTLVEPVENEETPYALPVYELDVKELTQIAGNELPVLKIDTTQNSPKIDLNYIPPCMAVCSYDKLVEQYSNLKQVVTEIVSVMNGKKSQYQQLLYPVTILLFDLEQFSLHNPPYYLVQLLKRTIRTIDFFVKHNEWNLTNVIKMPYLHDDISIILKSLAKCFQDVQQFIGKATVIKEKEEDFTPRI